MSFPPVALRLISPSFFFLSLSSISLYSSNRFCSIAPCLLERIQIDGIYTRARAAHTCTHFNILMCRLTIVQHFHYKNLAISWFAAPPNTMPVHTFLVERLWARQNRLRANHLAAALFDVLRKPRLSQALCAHSSLRHPSQPTGNPIGVRSASFALRRRLPSASVHWAVRCA